MPEQASRNAKREGEGAAKAPGPEAPSLPPVEEHQGPVPRRGPAFKTRYGRVEAAVWARDLDEGGTVFSVTLHRNYPDKEGRWQRTGALDEQDLLPAAKALDECYVFIQKDRQAGRGPGNGGR